MCSSVSRNWESETLDQKQPQPDVRGRHARILVLDGDMAAALAVVRSLSGVGHHISIASSVEKPIAAFSNGCRATAFYPDPLTLESDFIAWVVAYSREHAIDLIIPVTERSLVPLSRAREQLGGLRVSMASQDSLEVALDKSQTFALAQELGVKIPSGQLVESLDEIDALEASSSWPLVLKPVRSVSFDGRSYHKHSVSYAGDITSLRQQLRGALKSTPVMLQEHFSGIGVGVELIARDGDIRYAFQHERLHEVPLSGGGSSFRKSTDVSVELLDASRLLIKALRWHGVAMVEFKWNPQTGDYRLMEINGRLWGSLPLATAAGANFPAMMVELELEGDVRQWPAYTRGIYCRKLSRDIVWVEQALRTRASAWVDVPSPGRVLRDMARIFSPSHRFDVQSLSDPLPGVIDIGRICRSYTHRLGGVLAEKWFTSMQRIAWRNGTVRENLRNADSVLLLCYGNINRSALAEVFFRSRLEGRGVSTVSGGFHHEAGRLMDPTMAGIARAHGFDVEAFRSTSVTAQLIEESDVIFVMEKRHFDEVIRISPNARERVFLLGCCLNESEGPKGEIPDPYAKPEATYVRCYQTIETAVNRLLKDVT